MTVVGGLRSRPGVVIGGFVFAVLPTLLDSAHRAWGEGEAACASLPPDVLQFVIGLVVVGAIAEQLVHAVRSKGWTASTITGTAVGGAVSLAVLGGFAIGGFTGAYCLWGTIDALWEPLIGAGLLLLTLTQFPGGIAQQFAPVFSWLSFRPFDGGAAGAAAPAAGGSDARP